MEEKQNRSINWIVIPGMDMQWHIFRLWILLWRCSALVIHLWVLHKKKKNICLQVPGLIWDPFLLISALAHSPGVCYFDCMRLSEHPLCLGNLWLVKCRCMARIPEMSLKRHIDFWNKQVFSKSVVQDCDRITCGAPETRDGLAPPQTWGIKRSRMVGLGHLFSCHR